MAEKLQRFKKDRGYEEEDPQSRDALEAARRAKRGEIRDKRRKERKEERKKARTEVTAKGAKVGSSVGTLVNDGTMLMTDTTARSYAQSYC